MSKSKKRFAATRTQGNSFLKRLANDTDRSTKTKFIRTGVDIGGALAGGFIGSAIGKNAALFGLGILIAGDFMHDRTGLSKTVGSGMLAYGVAKFMEADATVQGLSGTGMKDRMGQYKDELLAAFYLDKLFKKSASGTTTASRVTANDDDGSVGAIDISDLDFFDDYNHQQANEFQYNRQSLPVSSISGAEDDQDDYDLNYASTDMPDLSRM